MSFWEEYIAPLNTRVKIVKGHIPSDQFRIGEKVPFKFFLVASKDSHVTALQVTLEYKETWTEDVIHFDPDAFDESVTKSHLLFYRTLERRDFRVKKDEPFGIEGEFIIPEGVGWTVEYSLEWAIMLYVTIGSTRPKRFKFPIKVWPIMIRNRAQGIPRPDPRSMDREWVWSKGIFQWMQGNEHVRKHDTYTMDFNLHTFNNVTKQYEAASFIELEAQYYLSFALMSPKEVEIESLYLKIEGARAIRVCDPRWRANWHYGSRMLSPSKPFSATIPIIITKDMSPTIRSNHVRIFWTLEAILTTHGYFGFHRTYGWKFKFPVIPMVMMVDASPSHLPVGFIK